ncbi:MAG: ABC transporter, partial [Polaromonas sp.]
MTPNALTPDNLLGMPSDWREQGVLQVHPGENVSASLEVDLNENLNFVKTFLILTDQRVISGDLTQKNWPSWTFEPLQTWVLSDHAGVGSLSLHANGQRLAVWRFTLGRLPAVLRFKAQFEALHKAASPAERNGTSTEPA